MHVERALRLIAGILLLASLALAHWVSPYWLFFTAFIGVNLFQSGLTDWCPMMVILRRCGLRCARDRDQNCDVVPESPAAVAENCCEK